MKDIMPESDWNGSRRNVFPVSRPTKIKPALAPVAPPSPPDVDKYHSAFLSTHDALAYMETRGIDRETCERFRIGYKTTTDGTGCIGFPTFKDGSPHLIKWRTLPPTEKTFRREPAGATSTLFNVDCLKDAAGKTVFVAEGEIDALTLLQASPEARIVGVPVGAGTFEPEWAAALADAGTVFIAYDGDTAGRDGAIKTARMIGLTRCRIIPMPDGKDVNDLYCDDPEGFRGLFIKLCKAAPLASNVEEIDATGKGNTDAMSEGDDGTSPRVLDRRDPYDNARIFLEAEHAHSEGRTLNHFGGVFRQWTGTHWPEADDGGIRARLWAFLAESMVEGDKQFKPTRSTTGDVLEALKSHAYIPPDLAPPAWTERKVEDLPLASEIVACNNGLLHIPTGELSPHTPRFFNANAVPFDFDPVATCPHWKSFLDELWDEDIDARETLQEIFGLLLTPETRYQKLFLIVGPKRAGKGTITRILSAMLGPENVAHPTLSSIGGQFGLAPLVDKSAAIIEDARLGGRTDQAALAERLLTISGEDAQTIDRKFLPALTRRLSVRFLIVSNELPRIADVSGALTSRFVILTLKESFFDKEDTGLTDRLLTELSGILNWALAGWRRLKERGRFIIPESSRDAMQELEELSSPISAFIRQRCELTPGAMVSCEQLFEGWGKWCKEQGRDHAGTAQTFGRDIRTAIPRIEVRRPHGLNRQYSGIRFRPDVGTEPQ
ncbi:MAG TPA: phage/plasmid primase, P4 family [Candidatus Deferrimicrobiaceae bacterium]